MQPDPLIVFLGKSFSLTLLLFGLYLIYVLGYCFFLKPYLRVKYFLKQGGVGNFCHATEFFLENHRNAAKYGSSFIPYLEDLKRNPKIRFFVKSIGSQPLVILSDMELTRQFLQNQQHYDKSRFFKDMNREVEVGLFMSSGENWRQSRRLLSPYFTFEALKKAVPTSLECSKKKYSQWINDGDLKKNCAEMFSQITGQIMLKYLYDVDLEEIRNKDGKIITDLVYDLMINLDGANDTMSRILFGARFVELGLISSHRRFNRVKKEMIHMSHQLITLAKKKGAPADSYVGKLIETEKVGENQYNEHRMACDLLNLLIAGTDTTSHNLGYMIYYLNKYPKIYQKLLSEIDREIPDLDKIDLDLINRLGYLNAVVKEALRLAPVNSWIFFREVLTPHKIGDIEVKPGDLVSACIPFYLQSEQFYSQPLDFIPERWLPDGPFPNDTCKKETYAFIPFSSGPRNCIGQHLAIIEAKVLLITFVKTFTFSFPEDYVLQINAGTVTDPLHPAIVTLKPIKNTRNV